MRSFKVEACNRHYHHRGRDRRARVGWRWWSGDPRPVARAQRLFLDGRGGLLIADVQDQRIRRLDLRTGIITTFAGTGDKARAGDGGPATAASIFGARAVRQPRKYIYLRAEGNGIRKVDAHGIMSTYAGTGERGYSGDRSPALTATWGAPRPSAVTTTATCWSWTLRTTPFVLLMR